MRKGIVKNENSLKSEEKDSQSFINVDNNTRVIHIISRFDITVNNFSSVFNNTSGLQKNMFCFLLRPYTSILIAKYISPIVNCKHIQIKD
jgi:CDP-glycerol glycerophosphotransferase (TagB/SpsB family)